MQLNNSKVGTCGRKHTAKNLTSFRGTYTAIITPFGPSGLISSKRLQKQIERQIEGGIAGIVPCGTTGESPTLTVEEHIEVIRLSVKFAKGRVKVVAGTGGNSTSEAIYLTKEAERAGANGSLQVTPYYNKPTQEGLFRHFSEVAQATKLPIILYDIPSRCGVGIAIQTVLRICEANTNVVGIKVANGSTDYVTELLACSRSNFSVLSGDDSQTLPFISVGADGVISVVSNILPARVAEMVATARVGDFERARRIHAELFPLTKALFLEGNPVGVKSAMEQLGWDSGMVRPPLIGVNRATAAAIRKELNGLINLANNGLVPK
jgi:4-hydroxy-tetrahydrodipicolinate synthase